jgi:hypothetical protein
MLTGRAEQAPEERANDLELSVTALSVEAARMDD